MLFSARPKTTHTNPNQQSRNRRKGKEKFNETILNATSVTVFFNLVKNRRINQSKLKQKSQKKRNVLRTKAYKTCVRREEYDLRGCIGGFLVQGGAGKG